MEKSQIVKTGLTIAVGAGVMLACKDQILPQSEATPGGGNNFTPTEISPTLEINKVTTGRLSVITSESQKAEILTTLPSTRPNILDGSNSYDVFDIQVGDKKFTSVMYPVAPETKIVTKNPADGTETETVQSVVMYTQLIDVLGNASWVRLFAVNPYKDRQVTDWFYDPAGMPQENQPADMNRPVLGYEIDKETGRVDIITYQPLIIQPDYIRGYDDTNPVSVTIVGEEPSGMKVQARPVEFHNDSPEQKLAVTQYFEPIKADPSTYTLKTENGIIVGYDKEGKKIFEDGKFDLRFLQQTLANSGDLMPTQYKPMTSGAPVGSNWMPDEAAIKYLLPLHARWRKEYIAKYGIDPYVKGKSGYGPLMLDPSINAWGSVWRQRSDNDGTDWAYLIYEKNTGEVGSVLLLNYTPGMTLDFWINQ